MISYRKKICNTIFSYKNLKFKYLFFLNPDSPQVNQNHEPKQLSRKDNHRNEGLLRSLLVYQEVWFKPSTQPTGYFHPRKFSRNTEGILPYYVEEPEAHRPALHWHP